MLAEVAFPHAAYHDQPEDFARDNVENVGVTRQRIVYHIVTLPAAHLDRSVVGRLPCHVAVAMICQGGLNVARAGSFYRLQRGLRCGRKARDAESEELLLLERDVAGVNGDFLPTGDGIGHVLLGTGLPTQRLTRLGG